MMPLDEIDHALRENPVDLAINIHSFSECQTAAIEWWARLLRRHQVKHLMVAPNCRNGMGRALLTNDRQDFLPVLQRHGFEPVVMEPKFLEPIVQKYGLQPTWYHLLELRG